jgi:hypothetical protein
LHSASHKYYTSRMTKVKPTTKEQLIYYLINNVSLGTYDRRFLSNLESMFLTNNRPLTTNQADLLNKIVHRYSRQLAKYELSANELVTLPWTKQPVESLPQFTETHLILVDDELILRSPYKSTFVKDFKKLDIQGKWEHDDRLWRIPASTHTLKVVKNCIEKHYSKINYCEDISSALDTISHLDTANSWKPTYVYTNGNFLVSCANEYLLEAIRDIAFDLTLDTLARLVAYGITIDQTVIDKFKEKFIEDEILFASDFTSKIEMNDSTLGSMLVKLKPDIVLFSEYISGARAYLNTVKRYLSDNNMNFADVSFNKTVDVTKYDYVILVESGISIKQQSLPYVGKSVQIVVSKPITIK